MSNSFRMEDKPPLLPPSMVLLLFLLLLLFCLMLGQVAGLAIGLVQGMDVSTLMEQLRNSELLSNRNLIRSMTLVNHLFTFVLPPVLMAWYLSRRNWLQYLRMDQIPRQFWVLLAAIWMLIAMPLAQWTYFINKSLPLPGGLVNMEESTNELIQSFLIMESPWEFLFSLLVMAILPAIGEEMVFRGVVQRNLEKITNNGHLAVWIGAFIFSAFHLQFLGFLPRFILGGVLGYLFLWSKNLWVPIAGHFLNNGLQVIAAYVMGEELLDPEGPVENSWTLQLTGIGALLISIGIVYYFSRRQRSANEGL